MKAVVLAATVLFVCAFLCHRTADGEFLTDVFVSYCAGLCPTIVNKEEL